MKGGRLIPQIPNSVKNNEGSLLNPLFQLGPHLVEDNSCWESNWFEQLSTNVKSSSIPPEVSNLQFELTSSSERHVLDRMSSYVSVRIPISSANGADFTAADIIVPPSGYFFLQSFLHEINRGQIEKISGNADMALNLYNLSQPFTKQKGSYFFPFNNSADVSAASVDITDEDYNEYYYRVNQEGIDNGSVATRVFEFAIPLSVFDFTAKAMSDINNCTPGAKHNYTFTLYNDLSKRISYSLSSGAALDSTSFQFTNFTIWSHYLQPAPPAINYINSLEINAPVRWLGAEYVAATNISDTNLYKFIRSYKNKVEMVAVMLTDASLTDANNKMTGTASSTFSDVYVEFNHLRIHDRSSNTLRDQFMRNYLIPSGFSPDNDFQAPLDFHDYSNAYNSLHIFDLSYVSRDNLSEAGDNNLFIRGNVNYVSNYTLHCFVLAESTAQVEVSNGNYTISNVHS